MDKLLAFGVLGLATGAIYAIAASGLVVTYTTSGIFNIAHGAIGMVSAFVYWQLRFDWGWSTPVSLVLVLLVFAPLFGAFLERVILRGLYGSSEVTKVIVTVGVMASLMGAVDWIWPAESRTGFRAFFEGNRVSVGGNNITWHSFITLGCAALVAIGLRWVLYRTRSGVAMRAVVDNRDLADLNGARPNRISQLAWAGSTSLAALAGVLLAGTQQLNVIPLTLLVVNAYAAAMFGRLRNLTATFVGAMVLGVATSYLVGYQSLLNLDSSVGSFALSGLRSSFPMIALFVVLLVLPQGRLRGSALLARRETSPEPTWRLSLFGAAAGVLFVIAVSGWISREHALLANNGLVFALAALSLVPLTGYAGMISLAPLTFAGLGAALMAKLPGGGNLVTLIATVLIVAAIGAVVALPALRLSGIYLALATGAFAVLMTNLVFNQSEWFPQANVSVPPLQLPWVDIGSPRAQMILLAVSFAIIGLATVALRKSSMGRRLVAMKDSEVALSTLGQNTRALKLVAFAVSAAIGSTAGALVGTRVVITDDYQFIAGLSVVLLAVVGGVGAVGGALIGGMMLGGNAIIAKVVPSVVDVSRVAPGLLGITMARSPDGVTGELRKSYDDSAKATWPLGVGTLGVAALWLLTQVDIISRWTFVYGLVVLVLTIVPVLPALVIDAISSARRMTMAMLLALSLTVALSIDWGSQIEITGQRVAILIVVVAVNAIAARGLLVPGAEEAASPDRIGLTERLTPAEVGRAERAIGAQGAQL